MIVAPISDQRVLTSVRRAARPDEDVVTGARTADAVRLGFPRAIVCSAQRGLDAVFLRSGLPTLTLSEELLGSWEEERRCGGPEVPPERSEYVAYRIRGWLRTSIDGPTWVDLCLRDLTRAVGRPLPPPFRGMARRVLEFPSRYSDIAALAGVAGLSAGALKARFRRRGLASPHHYLRWLRSVAVGEMLSERSVTTLEAAHRVGISSSGNLSRTVKGTTGANPTDLRRAETRVRLVVQLAERLLDSEALVGWDDFEDLFLEAA